MAMFNSYVSLPEGEYYSTIIAHMNMIILKVIWI